MQSSFGNHGDWGLLILRTHLDLLDKKGADKAHTRYHCQKDKKVLETLNKGSENRAFDVHRKISDGLDILSVLACVCLAQAVLHKRASHSDTKDTAERPQERPERSA